SHSMRLAPDRLGSRKLRGGLGGGRRPRPDALRCDRLARACSCLVVERGAALASPLGGLGFCLWMPVELAEQVAVALGAVSPGNRDVELGIAPHAVLGHVQSGGLDVLLDADA